MQKDCLTAESAPPELSDLFIVPNTISLFYPSSTFLFLSAFYSPACCHFSPIWDSFCVLIPVCASPSLCSPPLSPSSCLVFSWAVCRVCCWQELCTIGHKGIKIFFPGHRVHKAKMHRKHLPPKLWSPTRPTSSVRSKFQIPSRRRTSKI